MSERKSEGLSLVANAKRILEVSLAHSGFDSLDLVIFAIAKLYRQIESKKYYQITSFLDDSCEAAFNDLPPDVQYELTNILQKNIILSPKEKSEFLHSLFEVLSSETAKSDKGQYFTPSDVAKMCASSLNLFDGMSICDVACGSGVFLEEVAIRASEDAIDCSMYGFDISERAIKVAKTMAILNDVDNIHFEKKDSLKELQVTNKSKLSSKNSKRKIFDAIITNPPFAGDVGTNYEDCDYSLSEVNQVAEKDVLFVELCIELLKDNGQLVIVLPDNKFSGKRFASVRNYLQNNLCIRAVVSLHPNTFRPFTQQKTSVLFATKNNNNVCDDILFVKSQESGKLSNGKPSNKVSDYNEIAKLLEEKLH